MKKRLEELTQEQAGDIRNLHQELIGTQGAQQPERYSPCSQKTRTELETVSMAQLYDMTLTPRTPVVEGLVLPGTYLFAGSPKTGKSFFTAQLGYHVATGTPLWDYPVRQGEVLCLALEEDYSRLQNRLNQMFGVEAIDGFHFAIRSRTLAEGLVDQMEDFIRKHPSTRLIIVDTLQKVREAGNESYSYSMDYQNITALKAFSDSHNVAVLVVHHTRKMEANDCFDMISGTNGLLGAADGAFLLRKKKRTDTEAKLQIVGRDQEDQELTLEFDREKCIWNLTYAEKELFRQPVDPIVEKVAEFMKGTDRWSGTASELLEQLPDPGIKANILTRKLNVNISVLYNEFGILFTRDRSGLRREIILTRQDPEPKQKPASEDDDMTIHDGISEGRPVMEISS